MEFPIIDCRTNWHDGEVHLEISLLRRVSILANGKRTPGEEAPQRKVPHGAEMTNSGEQGLDMPQRRMVNLTGSAALLAFTVCTTMPWRPPAAAETSVIPTEPIVTCRGGQAGQGAIEHGEIIAMSTRRGRRCMLSTTLTR